MASTTILTPRGFVLNSFKEATYNTSAAATAKLMGLVPRPEFTPWIQATRFPEQRGTLVPAYVSAVLKKGGVFKVPIYGTYEELPGWFQGGIKGGVTPTGSTPLSIQSSTNATPIAITTTAPHNLATGANVFIAGHLINTNANGGWVITVTGASSFTLNGSVGNGIGGATGTAAIAPFTWTFPAPIATAWNPQSYTFEWAYDLATITAGGSLISKWSLGSDLSAEWQGMIEGWYATHTQNGTLTPALTDRQVEIAIMPVTALSMDAGGGTIGATAFTNTLVKFGIEATVGLKPVFSGGAYAPVSFTYDVLDVTLNLTLYKTTAVKTFLINTLYAGTNGLIRLKSTGTAGKSIQLDFSGVLNQDPALYPDRDSAVTVDLKLAAQYDAVFGNSFVATVVNNLAQIP